MSEVRATQVAGQVLLSYTDDTVRTTQAVAQVLMSYDSAVVIRATQLSVQVLRSVADASPNVDGAAALLVGL